MENAYKSGSTRINYNRNHIIRPAAICSGQILDRVLLGDGVWDKIADMLLVEYDEVWKALERAGK